MLALRRDFAAVSMSGPESRRTSIRLHSVRPSDRPTSRGPETDRGTKESRVMSECADRQERGRFAYEAYRRFAAAKALRFASILPDFDDLSPAAQAVWIEAADAICDRFGAIN